MEKFTAQCKRCLAQVGSDRELHSKHEIFVVYNLLYADCH